MAYNPRSPSTKHFRETALAEVIYNLWEATNCSLYNMAFNSSRKAACLFKRRHLIGSKLPKALAQGDWHFAVLLGRESV